MKKNNVKQRMALLTATLLLLTSVSISSAEIDIYNGFYSRPVEVDRSAHMASNKLYIKFYPDDRVILLNIPYPYSNSVADEIVHRVFITIRNQIHSNAFIKGTFDLLEEAAIASVDTYTMENERALFSCGNSITCTAEFNEHKLRITSPGIVGERITIYQQTVE